MKISALRKMISEEVRKVIREELKSILSEAAPAPKKESGINEIRERFKASRSGGLKESYEDLQQPKNDRALVKGEHFASGQGVLDWFKESRDEQALREHKAKLEQMEKTDEYVEDIIRRRV